MEQTPAQRTAAAVRAELARKQRRPHQLAKALGWTASTTSRRLNGVYPFTITELVAVADYLEVPLTALLPQDAETAA